MTGTLPTELGLLQNLEVLTLKNNMLRGSVPQELANLKKLKTLDLTQCFLTGTLPQRFESPELASLLLANNAISGKFFHSDDSPHLGSITEIRMENNLLTGTLHGPTLRKMPELKMLSISDNDLSGLIPGEELGSLAELKYLYLDANAFVGPLPPRLAREGGAGIMELWLQDNALSGTVPSSYARFDELHDFFIDGNKLTGAVPPGMCSPMVNADFFENLPEGVERNFCDSIACPAGSVALEGLYPCTVCPGGEAARIKNRYIGQQGRCLDHTQRDVLRIFHEATTKGGAWSGVSDWNDPAATVCRMTGVTCDAHGNVVKIELRNRGLRGRIPDEVGFLPFLEVLDVADNALVGHVPGDLRWTSLTQLDVSGNRIRGAIPPLLCRTEDLNGNGGGGVFHCDRIACPAGTFNAAGFRHGVDGEECAPCHDDSPYIAQKTCLRRERPEQDWGETADAVNANAAASESLNARTAATDAQPGISAQVGLAVLGIVVGSALVAVVLASLVRYTRGPRQKYRKYERATAAREHLSRSFREEGEDDDGYDEGEHIARAPRYRDGPRRPPRYSDDPRGDVVRRQDRPNVYDGEEEADDYSFHDYSSRPDRPDLRHDPSLYRASVRGGYHDDDDAYDSEEDGTLLVPWPRRGAAEFVREHQGIALGRGERLRRSLSGRLAADTGLGRRAREAASGINVGARRRLHDARVRRLASSGS